MNYSAQFCSLDGKDYKIQIIADSGNTYTELTFAGGSSLTLEYSNSETPFDPIRTSTLSMTFLNSDYLQDLLKPHADDVLVKLYSKGHSSSSWNTRPDFIGYLQQAGSQNAGYVNCLEQVTLTANDVLLTAQFKKYTNKSGTAKKQVVLVSDLLERFQTMFNLFEIRWPKSKLMADEDYKQGYNDILAIPEHLHISENNFYSSDTDNAWDWMHIIESLAKYFGFTALMYQDSLYFIDYLDYARVNETTFANKFTQYVNHRAGDNYWGNGNYSNVMKRITDDSYRGSGHQISFNPIYNKVKVVDNYYEVDELIPNIFDDSKSQNMYENKKACRYVAPRLKPCRYINKDGVKTDDAGENYLYYKRELKHGSYDEHWYSGTTELSQQEVKNWTDYEVINYDEYFQGTSVTIYGWEASFWGGTPAGITASFQIEGGVDTVLVRWNSGYHYDINGNLVPSFSMFVDSANYQDILTTNDFDYQWHEYDDGVRHFYYGINGNSFYFVPIPNPITSIAPYTYWGFVTTDTNGIVEERFPITSYPPIVNYSASIVVPGSNAVYFAWLQLKLDNSTNDEAKDYDITFNYADNSGGTVNRTARLEPHAVEYLDLYIYPAQTIYGGSDIWSITVNGLSQSFTRKTKNNPTLPYGTNVVKLHRGARLFELANFSKADYQNEIPSNISFSKYLCIAQHGGTTGTTGTSFMDRYKVVYTLNDSVAPAVIINKDTGIIIDADALFQRYWGTDYINPEWTGEQQDNIQPNPALIFTLGIGDQYWNGHSWQNSKCAFAVPLQWTTPHDDENYDSEDENVWNTSLHVKNQIKWEEWAGETGYFIPLSGVSSLNGSITFEIRMPREAQEVNPASQQDMNGVCWISRLDVSLGNKGSELDDLNDVVFENIIDSDAVNEFSPVNLDITSYPGLGKMSYSHLGYYGKLFQHIRDINLYAEPLPEETNLIQRYVHQFDTKTVVKDLELKISQVEPFWAFIDVYDDNDRYQPYVVLGQSKDYYMGVCNVHLMELKKYYEYPECNVLKLRFSNGNYPQPELPAHYILDDMNNDLIDIKSTPDGNGGYIVEYVFVHPIGNFARGFPSIFRGLTNLTDVWLPSTLGKTFSTAYFYPTAFSGCSNLNHIVFNSKTAPRWFSNFVFEGISSTGLMEFPQGANYNDWYKALPEDWSGIIFTDTATTIGVGSVYTVATKNFTYVGSSAANLRATSNKEWITTQVSNNGGNSYTVTMAVSENKKTTTRSAQITVTDGSKTKYLTVNQSSAAKYLATTPPINSAATINFDAEGKPTAVSTDYVEIGVITNGDGSDITLTSSDSWINANWNRTTWTDYSDGRLIRYFRITTSKSAISRSGTIVISDGTNSITASIAQSGKAKVSWSVYVWSNGRWINTSWSDRNATHANVYSDSEYVLVKATLSYDGMPDYSSGTNLNMIIDQTNSNFAAGPTNPVKFQVNNSYEGQGYQFVPCFTKTMPAQYQEMFAQPTYSNCAYCAFPWRAKQGDVGQWDLSYNLNAGDEVRLRLYSEDVPIELENTTIYLKLKS